MGIEPTHQLVTGALVLKGIKHRKQRFDKPTYFLTNPLRVKGFPVFRIRYMSGFAGDFRPAMGIKKA